MELNNGSFLHFQNNVAGSSSIKYNENHIDYNLFTASGMSGGPVYVELGEKKNCYLLAMHWGKIESEKNKTFGVLMGEDFYSNCVNEIVEE